MLKMDNQNEIELGLTYLNKKEICADFWTKLRSDNKKVVNKEYC